MLQKEPTKKLQFPAVTVVIFENGMIRLQEQI